jgi:sigma-B regulation protein RsbU (phosphoserine phosphatase)
MTRNTEWKVHPDPWHEKHKLPLLSGGMLAEIVYSNEPAVIRDLPSKVSKEDPAYELLHDMKLLISLPHFDNGESINAGILLNRTEDFPFEQLPMMIWQANLWGRATLNLVTQQKLAAAYTALDRELQVVADIQHSLLPRELPKIKNTQVAAHYRTSQRAGGDYYDFFPLPEAKWGIFLADVSGHGTPAAVLMAVTHAIAHTHPGAPMPPEATLAYINKVLGRLYTNNNGTFVTAFYGVYDPERRVIEYASAGHPPARHLRGGKVLGVDGETSLPLGIATEETYLQHRLELAAGDQLLLYTDGVPDTFNEASEAFGLERLDNASAEVCTTPEGMIAEILRELQAFGGKEPQTDDQTLIAFRFE